MDGIYNIEINTPMGMINGKIALKTHGDKVEGNLQIMGMNGNFEGNKKTPNTCEFSGKLNTMLGIIQYQVIGKLIGERLEIQADTNKGKIELIGRRISK